jgi:hypothetical protein
MVGHVSHTFMKVAKTDAYAITELKNVWYSMLPFDEVVAYEEDTVSQGNCSGVAAGLE